MSRLTKYVGWVTKLFVTLKGTSNYNSKYPDYLFDFRGWKGYGSGKRNRTKYNISDSFIVSHQTEEESDISGVWDDSDNTVISESSVKYKDTKVKPIDILDELVSIPQPFHMRNIDKKINNCYLRLSHLRGNRFAKQELEGMIERLENRKQFKHFKEFFSRFDYVSPMNVNSLLKKYSNLRLGDIDLFLPEMPAKYVDIMEDYQKHCKKLCGMRTVILIIADAKDFSNHDDKRDPILLAQSPFSFNYQVLGAWGEEEVLVPELF